MRYNHVKYIGETIQSINLSYLSDTILTKGKTYKLIRPYYYKPNDICDCIIRVEDDILLNKPDKFSNEYEELLFNNYYGNHDANFSIFELIPNRDFNLDYLINDI